MRQQEMIFLVEEDPEGGYNAKSMNSSIFTEAETLDELKVNIKDALKCHYDDENQIPEIIRLHIVTEEILSYG